MRHATTVSVYGGVIILMDTARNYYSKYEGGGGASSLAGCWALSSNPRSWIPSPMPYQTGRTTLHLLQYLPRLPLPPPLCHWHN